MKLSKDLYDRICWWMADKEDPSILAEQMEADGMEFDHAGYMLEEAFDIIYAVYSAHVGEIPLGQRLMEEEENN